MANGACTVLSNRTCNSPAAKSFFTSRWFKIFIIAHQPIYISQLIILFYKQLVYILQARKAVVGFCKATQKEGISEEEIEKRKVLNKKNALLLVGTVGLNLVCLIFVIVEQVCSFTKLFILKTIHLVHMGSHAYRVYNR